MYAGRNIYSLCTSLPCIGLVLWKCYSCCFWKKAFFVVWSVVVWCSYKYPILLPQPYHTDFYIPNRKITTDYHRNLTFNEVHSLACTSFMLFIRAAASLLGYDVTMVTRMYENVSPLLSAFSYMLIAEKGKKYYFHNQECPLYYPVHLLIDR